MQGIVLPTERAKPTRLVPKISVFYGIPKVGKTGKCAELENALFLDGEGGAEMYECMRLAIDSPKAVIEAAAALGQAKKTQGKPAYRFGIIDTVDTLEDQAIAYQTWLYNKDRDKKDQVQRVTDLDYGRGYGYVRDCVKTWLLGFAGAFDHLIILSHVRDKTISTKENSEVVAKDLSLQGKLGEIVCAMADVIGYVYRDLSEELRVSFQTSEARPTMGARFDYLAGKDIKWEWDAIFPPDRMAK